MFYQLFVVSYIDFSFSAKKVKIVVSSKLIVYLCQITNYKILLNKLILKK